MADDERPKTRGDCVGGCRPCPWVSCRYHLLLDLGDRFGEHSQRCPEPSIFVHTSTMHECIPVTQNGQSWESFADRAVDALKEMPDTCALDVADRDGATGEEIAAILGCSRQNVQQVELKAIKLLRANRKLRRELG